MNGSNVHFLWKNPRIPQEFRTGVSLHGHTLHSQECLSFLPRYLHRVPGLSQVVRRYEKTPPGGRPAVDFSRAYWTPPLTPATALQLERSQIEGLGLQPLVSLTDHDDIEAPMALQVTATRKEVPVSLEWTVPYAHSILHLGIHNLPADSDRSWMAAMQAYTKAPGEDRLPELLSALDRIPEALIVLNHPFWLEEGVVEDNHRRALDRFFTECLPWVHAFELNATRSWRGNAGTIALSQAHGRPVISGGDRHACEPSGNINLTNAQSFSEFAAEVRQGHSTLLFMPQYREPLGLRILEASWDILRPYPEYPGRERWMDRIFYFGENDVARSLSAIWKDRTPWMLNGTTGIVQLLATHPMRGAMRVLLANRGEAIP
jgi:hypothetical protein